MEKEDGLLNLSFLVPPGFKKEGNAQNNHQRPVFIQSEGKDKKRKKASCREIIQTPSPAETIVMFTLLHLQHSEPSVELARRLQMCLDTGSLSVHVFLQGCLVTCIYYQICLEKHKDKRIGVGQAEESTGLMTV